MFKQLILLLLLSAYLTFAQTSFNNPRVGIVISKTSFEQHWGVTQMSAHGWGGVANLAGIPYDCFFVEDLSETKDLDRYSCLIFSQCTYLTDDSYNKLLTTLKKYLAGEGSLIIDGIIGHFDETTKERDHSDIDELLGIRYTGFYGGPEFRIKVLDDNHFITRDVNKGQYITQHLAGGLNIQSFPDSTGILLELTDEKVSYPFLSVRSTSANRTVLVNDIATWSSVSSIFRNEQPRVFYNNYIYNILVEALYWTIYGNVNAAYPSLQVTNADLTAIIRLDADASGNLNAQIQTMNYLINIAEETGVVPLYAWVASTIAKAGWQDVAPLGKKLETTGGQIGTHSKFHNIDTEMTDQRWKEELDDAIKEIEFNMADYGYDIGKVDCFINPGNTIHMSDYNQVAKRFGFYMTHGFEQDMPIGFGNFTWYNEDYKNFVVLENTPSPDYQWFYDPTWSYTTQQITAYEESIYDHLYNIVQRGVIFNQMWHDYSITSQPQYGKDRIVNTNNLAMYDAVRAKFKNTNIYAPEPEDLRNKICIMAQTDYRWSTNGNEIDLKLDFSKLGLDSALNYTGGMGIKINNSSKPIKQVLIDGNDHYAFSNDVVILPNLSDSNVDIKIILGDNDPDQPRVTYVSKRFPRVEQSANGLSFNIITKCLGKFNVKYPGNSVLINADGFNYEPGIQNSINGYVNSSREVILKNLKNNKIFFKRSTMQITGVEETGNTIKMKLKSSNKKDINTLKFEVTMPVRISLDKAELNVKPEGNNYLISFPPFDGEKELIINLK